MSGDDFLGISTSVVHNQRKKILINILQTS